MALKDHPYPTDYRTNQLQNEKAEALRLVMEQKARILVEDYRELEYLLSCSDGLLKAELALRELALPCIQRCFVNSEAEPE